MTEAHRETPQAGSAWLGAAVKGFLTVVVGVGVWVGILLVSPLLRLGLQPQTFPDREINLDLQAYLPDEVRDQRARFPLPLYPGAQDPEFGEMEFNGKPFKRCDYDVAASPDRVLAYYRDQMKLRGWTDTTEEILRQAAMTSESELSQTFDLQNETLLRHIDHQLRTQASFSRHGRQALIAVAEGRLAWTSRVGIQVIEYDSPQELSQDLQRTMMVSGHGLDQSSPATFKQNLGGQQAETSLFTRRDSPALVAAQIIQEHEATGWQNLNLPQERSQEHDAFTASMTRGDQMMFLHVTHDVTADASRAVLSIMRPR